MAFSNTDLINLLAICINIIGSFLMFYYSSRVNSQTYMYLIKEMEAIKKLDEHKNKMVRHGLFLLFIGFILQAVALLFNSVLN
jgi:uncharacterized protein YxeA